MNQQQMMILRKLQKQMEEAQAKLEATVFKGTAGGGVVSVEIKGSHEVVSVTIDPEAAKDDIELVQDMVVIALNDAMKKIDEESSKIMGGFGGGLGFGF